MDNSAHAGRYALDELDEILAGEPAADHAKFSSTTRYLSAFRDQLIAEYRPGRPTPSQRKRLQHVNAVISLVMGGHFPLGGVPWGELRRARAWLEDAVEGK